MRSSESGNVFFYIFVCVALLAALSFAVGQSGRTSLSALTADRLNLAASEIIDYGSVVSKAVTQLRLRGLGLDQIRFAHPDHNAGYGTITTTPERQIFTPEGGGIVFRVPPPDALATPGTQFQYSGNNEIDSIGTTCGNASCSDLIMLLGGLREDICIRINETLGVDNPGGTPPQDSAVSFAQFFSGTYAFAQTVGNEAGSAAVSGQTTGCFEDLGSSEFVFFQVLLPR